MLQIKISSLRPLQIRFWSFDDIDNSIGLLGAEDSGKVRPLVNFKLLTKDTSYTLPVESFV